jgi:hypothetical protein
LVVTNTLAYFVSLSVTKRKSIITLTLVVNVIKLFFFITNRPNKLGCFRKSFHPGMIFASKARACKGRALLLIKPNSQFLTIVNSTQVMQIAEKSFVTLTPHLKCVDPEELGLPFPGKGRWCCRNDEPGVNVMKL